MYSIWSLFYAIWSTPCGHYFMPYGVLYVIAIHVNCGKNIQSSIRLVFSALWSTPYGLELLPYGVLHMALNYCHMEYSIWGFSGAKWSSLELNLSEHYKCCLMYSIWSPFDAIWSTPRGHFLLPYGVLHAVTISCHMEYSIWSLWSSYSHVHFD